MRRRLVTPDFGVAAGEELAALDLFLGWLQLRKLDLAFLEPVIETPLREFQSTRGQRSFRKSCYAY